MVQETVQTEGLQVGLQRVLLQEEAHLVFASQISDSLIEQRFHSSWGEVNKFMNIQTGSCWVNKESQIRLEAKLRLKSRTQLSPILESKKSNHQRMNGAWPDWTHNTAESYNPHNALESLCFYPFFCFVLFSSGHFLPVAHQLFYVFILSPISACRFMMLKKIKLEDKQQI